MSMQAIRRGTFEPDFLAGTPAFVFEDIEIHSPTGVFRLGAQRHQRTQRFFLWFLSGEGYQGATVTAGQCGHTRLQGHVEVGRTHPGGQIEDQQREGTALQQFDRGGGRQLRLFGKDDHQMGQIHAGPGQIGRKRRGLGIAHPGRPFAGALAFQQQLEGRAEVTAALTGQLDQPSFDIKIGHPYTLSGVHLRASRPCFNQLWEAIPERLLICLYTF
jgi:hypothetical protein